MKTFWQWVVFSSFTGCVVYTLVHAYPLCDLITFAMLVLICLIAELSVVQQTFFEPTSEDE